ncbi:MAG: lysophospholipid acyltransferase family protein [Parcubacteria group bacterium]
MIVQHILAAIASAVTKIFMAPKISGIINLEKAIELSAKEKRSIVFISNHLSDFDPVFIFGSFPFKIRKIFLPATVLGKVSLFDRWCKKAAMHAMGCISVGNDLKEKGWRAHLLKIVRMLKKQKNIFFFPEGKVCLDGELGKDLGVVTTLARFESFVLLPIRITGIKNFRPNRFKILTQGKKLSIMFGEPVLIQKGSRIDAMETIKGIDRYQCYSLKIERKFD